MIFNFGNIKYDIQITSRFKNDYKKIKRQRKDINREIKNPIYFICINECN